MKKNYRQRLLSLTVILSFLSQAVFLTACSAQASGEKTVIVASKDFTEEFILGEMYAQLLEKNGFKVTRKMNLGGTPVVQEAMLKGQVDLYPEYTGTGLLTVLKLPSNSDPQAVYNTVKDEYQKQFNLVWLDASPMNDTQALAMTQEKAQQYGIKTISDMIAKASELTMVGPPEFREREDGIPGLKKAYGDFNLKAYKDVDPGLRYQTLLSGAADVAVAFSTDGEIAVNHLLVLQDNKHLWPPYQVAPVVRKAVLDKYPEIATILNPLSSRITDEVMQRLNFEVSGNKREPADVAKEFLTQQGFLK